MRHIAQQWRVACALRNAVIAGTGSVYGVIQQKFRLSRGWPCRGVIGVAEFLTRRRPISPTSVVMLCGCGHLHCRRSNQRCAQGGQDYLLHWSILFTRRANLMMELRLRPARRTRATKTPSSACRRFESCGLRCPQDVLVGTDPAQTRGRTSDMAIKCDLLN
jgi:hypothetical protein